MIISVYSHVDSRLHGDVHLFDFFSVFKVIQPLLLKDKCWEKQTGPVS